MIETSKTQSFRHWQVSMALFEYFDDSIFEEVLGGSKLVRMPLFAAAAGHHGGPPEFSHQMWGNMIERAGEEACKDAKTAITEISKLFPNANLNDVKLSLKKADGDWKRSAKSLSWWLTGVITVADWIGSNTDWFPPTQSGPCISDYWEMTQARAEIAVERCGIAAAKPSSGPAAKLFNFSKFTPMQERALEVGLPPGPTLAIMEDATGSGKTEAALMLAQRLMQRGAGDGIFFALPTMATANAMYDRLGEMRHMFEGVPSLALAHSRAKLDKRFSRFALLDGRHEGEPDGEFSCAQWLSDGRRKSLLAQIGVGTIDQALLGVLPTRFMGLRLYALSQRILIVDEAHDYDAFMQAELEALLTFHAMLGGSAILMTATLPKAMRQKFVHAYQRGASRNETIIEAEDYPHLAIVGAEANCQSVAPVNATIRKVGVQRVGSLDAAIDFLANAARKGAAAAFIRNSVDEAISAVESLRLKGVKAVLHHARFALCDRLENEQCILDMFGKQGTGRSGIVVVGTQVLEQSLDIDFDVMVSDLAPMGALIQRAGRLWRHIQKFPATCRPVPGPTLHVLSPDPDVVNSDKWSRNLLGKGWYVYSPPVQWRTAKALFAQGEIISPGGIRALIEAVDGDNVPAVPEALMRAENDWIGEMLGERAQAAQNLLNPFEDYRDAGRIFSDELFPTRLGSEQVTLILARRTSAGLQPWSRDEDLLRAWALSEVSVSRKRWEQSGGVDQTVLDIAQIRSSWKDWQHNNFYLCPVDKQGRVEERIAYSEANGLTFLP